MYKVILLMVILINTIPVLADNFVHTIPYGNNGRYYKQNIANRRLNNRINTLEKYAFNRTYSSENEIMRLERLENLTFGSIQSGDIGTRFRNVENAILSRGQNVYRKNLLSTIGNYLSGQTTGVTPSILPYNNIFYPSYNNSYTNQYSNGIFNQGYRNFGNSYGSGSSIRILE